MASAPSASIDSRPTNRRGIRDHLRFAMTDRTALRNLGRTAEKWRELAQSRRDYFRELRGRWRRFYHRGASQSSVILNMAPMLGPVAMRLLRSL